MKRGVELLEDVEGTGLFAQKGNRVVFNLRIFLHRGDEVPLNEIQFAAAPDQPVTIERGRRLLDRTITLGKRQAAVAIEQALLGMKKGGYRRVRASPHLAYGKKGIPGLIPANAVLVLEVWLREFISSN
ncbi:FKBP-type peptidyl-prolyl cis-trans isomerase [bacterium]|nr:FKBP-type peptidyl-prolyl cis-trans isomerase [bacterium]MCI0606548.1 FKBP-type peptidyl-prolyl cis-trans isomerase [bacterium]